MYVRPPVINPMTPPVTWSGVEEAAAIEDSRHEIELADAFAGIQPEIRIKEGDIWSGLTSALEEKNIDTILIGTLGRSGISKFVLGSIAEKIFRQAPCPVLTVGPHTPAPEKRSGEITILFATDFSPESNAVPYAVSLAQECQAYLTLIHVIKPQKASDLVQAADLVKSSTHLLHNFLPSEAELWCVPEYVVEQGNPGEKILEVARRTGAELIVLGVRPQSQRRIESYRRQRAPFSRFAVSFHAKAGE